MGKTALTRQAKLARAEYMRNYRKRVSSETKAKWVQQHRVKRREAQEAEKKTKDKHNKEVRAIQNRRAYVKLKNKPSTPCPSTPNSKTEFINNMIETATPTTSEKLSEKKIYTRRERDAKDSVANAAKSVVKDSKVRKKLLAEMKGNKKAISETLNLSRNHFYYKSQKGSNPKVSHQLMQDAIKFYSREDVTTRYPNKRKNLLVLKQSRAKTHKMFLEENPGCSISLSSFIKLQPKHVKLMRAGKWLQCLCDICENVQMICRSIRLSTVRSNMPSECSSIFEPGKELELCKLTVCSLHNDRCVMRKCKDCSARAGLEKYLSVWVSDDDRIPINYNQWERVTEKVKGKDITKLKKVAKSGPRWKLFSELCDQFGKYPLHLRNAINQYKAYKNCKENISSTEVVCVVDFAENFTCRPSAEVQSAYYSRTSVTMHPMVCIFNKESDVRRDSVFCISNDLTHDASAVSAFIKVLVEHLQLHYPSITNIKIWSDGCAAQYKSRRPMFNLAHQFEIPQHLSVEWNFYGSRHGKGESDGETGVIKTFLDTEIRAKELTFDNAHEVYNYLMSSDRHILDGSSQRHFYYVPSADMDAQRSLQQLNLPAIPLVRSIHQVRSLPPSTLLYRRSSCFCSEECRHPKEWKRFTFPGMNVMLFVHH